MTDEAKALVAELREDYHLWQTTRIQAADLIETQAREIERLRELIGGALTLQQTYFGDATKTHLQLSAWATLARAALGESHDQ